MYVCMYVCICASICASIFVCMYLSIYLSIYVSIYVSMYLSIYLSIYVIYLSIKGSDMCVKVPRAPKFEFSQLGGAVDGLAFCINLMMEG